MIHLHELASVCRHYSAVGDFDSALLRFRRVTNGRPDYRRPRHLKALFEWLNAWGCRQFARRYHGVAAKELREWGRRWLKKLPRAEVALSALAHSHLEAAVEAYEDLKTRRACMRRGPSGRYKVRYGATGAAKVLFALRPVAFPPWDKPIREHFGYDESARSYGRFLQRVRAEIKGLEAEAARAGMSRGRIPAAVGRPHSSLPKLIDEYYWLTITWGLAPPSRRELAQWVRWARLVR